MSIHVASRPLDHVGGYNGTAKHWLLYIDDHAVLEADYDLEPLAEAIRRAFQGRHEYLEQVQEVRRLTELTGQLTVALQERNRLRMELWSAQKAAEMLAAPREQT